MGGRGWAVGGEGVGQRRGRVGTKQGRGREREKSSVPFDLIGLFHVSRYGIVLDYLFMLCSNTTYTYECSKRAVMTIRILEYMRGMDHHRLPWWSDEQTFRMLCTW